MEEEEEESDDSPGLFSFRPFRPPHSLTLEIRTKICFWHRDLLLLGQGFLLLATGRFCLSSLTARFCLMRELARAAIFPPPLTFGRGVSSYPTAPLQAGLSVSSSNRKWSEGPERAPREGRGVLLRVKREGLG